MLRPLLAMLAVLCTLAPAARADIPYWQARYAFFPFVRALAVDPTDANVVYVGASSAATYFGEYGELTGTGVFRSTDGGHTFSPRNVGLGNLLVSALAIAPSNPNVLYAGLLGAGVYKTTDAGLTWAAANVGLTNLDVYGLTIDPTDPNRLFVGCEAGGVFRSLDGGGSWTVSFGLGNVTVFGFAVDPVAPTTVYAATQGSVWKSTNGGASFAPTGPLTIDAPGGGTPDVVGEVHAIVIDASNHETLLAGTHEGGGVFRSTDAGASWTHTSTGLLSEFGNWRFVDTLAQDPVTPAVFYASSTRATYRSSDGGITWAPFNAGLSRGEAFAFGVGADAVYTGSVFGEFHRLQVRPSGVNHFRCFQARAKGFVPQTLTVSDRFGTATALALKPVRYCTPTNPMAEGVVDPTAHLVCYKLAKAPFEEQFVSFLTQRIDGYRGYQVRKPDTLCLPATAGTPAAAPRDAYRCLAGPHYASNPIDFTIADAYGSQLIRRHKIDRLCVPTDLDGGGGANRIESDVDLRCDQPKGKIGPFARTSVTTTDRFGTLTLNLIKPDSHCFPALESRQ